MTTETTDHPGGYAGAMEDFYREAAERIAAHLDAGRDVALLAEGDPLFYSSYMHMHTRLTERFDAVIVPGVTSVSAASAATGTPLVQGDEVLTILPGTLPVDELHAQAGRHRRRGDPEARDARIPLCGKRFRRRDDWTRRTTWSARARRSNGCCPPPTSTTQRCRTSRSPCCRAPPRRRATGSGSVAVVGLGPGDIEWMTPQSRRELAAATDLIGYGPYLDRVRPRDGQRRTPATTPTNPHAPGWRARSPSRAAPSRWCRPATPASSRWPRPCSRRPSSGRASRCG